MKKKYNYRRGNFIRFVTRLHRIDITNSTVLLLLIFAPDCTLIV
jgi:hypothetical protein